MAIEKTAEELLKEVLLVLKRAPQPHTMFNSAHVKLFGDAIAEVESYFKRPKRGSAAAKKASFDTAHADWLVRKQEEATTRRLARERVLEKNSRTLTEGNVKSNNSSLSGKVTPSVRPPPPPPVKAPLPKE